MHQVMPIYYRMREVTLAHKPVLLSLLITSKWTFRYVRMPFFDIWDCIGAMQSQIKNSKLYVASVMEKLEQEYFSPAYIHNKYIAYVTWYTVL